MQATVDRLSVELGRSPHPAEVAEAAHLTPERVNHALWVLSARFASPDHDATTTNAWELSADIIDLRDAVGRLSVEDRRFVLLLVDADMT